MLIHSYTHIFIYLIYSYTSYTHVYIQYGRTPLHTAAANGRNDMVLYFLDETNADVNARDKVCMYVCMYVYVYVYVCIYMCVYVYVYVYVHVYVYEYAYEYMYEYAYVCVCVHV